MVLAEALLSWVLASAIQAEAPWYQHYERGVTLVHDGSSHEARLELEQALAGRSEEGLQVHTEGLRSVDYLPHLYLAIAYHMEGDVARAREHLEKAEQWGLAARSEAGRPLLEAYRILLRGSPPATTPERPRFNIYPKRPPVLSQGEFERVRSEVLGRCRLKPDTEPATAPWYFHYELGLTLFRKGDGQRALDAFVEAAGRRGDPQHMARLYGVWFADYLPYFQIARAHAALGNWDCAADALAVSRQMGEISAKDHEYEELRELAREIDAQVKP